MDANERSLPPHLSQKLEKLETIVTQFESLVPASRNLDTPIGGTALNLVRDFSKRTMILIQQIWSLLEGENPVQNRALIFKVLWPKNTLESLYKTANLLPDLMPATKFTSFLRYFYQDLCRELQPMVPVLSIFYNQKKGSIIDAKSDDLTL